MTLPIKNILVEDLLDAKSLRTENTITVTSASTLSLTAASPLVQSFTGSTNGQILKLPNATTLQVGHHFWCYNVSSVAVEFQDFDGNTLVNSIPSDRVFFILRDNGTTAGAWDKVIGTAAGLASVSPTLAFFNGNGNVGRYLEIFPREDSLSAPLIVPANSAIVALTLGVNSETTGTVGIFEMADLVTPVVTISLVAEIEKVNLNLFAPLNQGDALAIRITAGSMQKPRIAMYLSGI